MFLLYHALLTRAIALRTPRGRQEQTGLAANLYAPSPAQRLACAFREAVSLKSCMKE
jgi:hypothetical protein